MPFRSRMHTTSNPAVAGIANHVVHVYAPPYAVATAAQVGVDAQVHACICSIDELAILLGEGVGGVERRAVEFVRLRTEIEVARLGSV